MYDRNGLQLSPVSETMNSYRLTAVQLKTRKYTAYCRSKPNHKNDFSMHRIGDYTDPRDAAFVAQEFEKQYDIQTVKQLHTDGLLTETAKNFRETIEIPEWKFPAEGLLIEDILNDYGYKTNRVSNSKEALREGIKLFGLKVPSLKEVSNLIKKVETKYEAGMDYRAAARDVLGV